MKNQNKIRKRIRVLTKRFIKKYMLAWIETYVIPTIFFSLFIILALIIKVELKLAFGFTFSWDSLELGITIALALLVLILMSLSKKTPK